VFVETNAATLNNPNTDKMTTEILSRDINPPKLNFIRARVTECC
jgi:hypothetical protein